MTAGDMHVRLRCLAQRVFLCTAVALAAPVSASAADFASPGADEGAVPPTALAEDWTGFYVGLGLGGRSTDAEWTTGCLALAALPAGCPNDFFGGATRIGNDNPAGFDDGAFRLSGYLGFDWQISNWVLGIEADGGWADNRQTRTGIPGTWSTDFGVGFDTAKVESEWDASVRARVGFLLTPSLLAYSTGGIALLHQEVGASCEGAFPVGWCMQPNTDSDSGTYAGWTIGGGAEWMFASHWTVRGEYRYSDYGSESFILFEDAPIDSVGFSVEQEAHVAYVGLGYRF